MTDDKLYTSMSANTIMAKVTNHFQQTKHHLLANTIHLTLKSLFRTTLTQTITPYKLRVVIFTQQTEKKEIQGYVECALYLEKMSLKVIDL